MKEQKMTNISNSDETNFQLKNKFEDFLIEKWKQKLAEERQRDTADMKLKEHAQAYAERHNLPFKFWEDQKVYHYQVGQEEATYRVRLVNAQVGDRETVLRGAIKLQEYNAFPWWKEVADAVGADWIFE